MDHFDHREGRLHAEQVPLDRLARAVGTPAYVYSWGTIRDHVASLRAAFEGLDPLICYAVKANSNLALLRRLAGLEVGFDIVSGGELARVVSVGACGERVVFSGVGKTRAEMRAALAHEVLLFNVESEAELEVLAAVAAEAGRTAPFALRVNPDVDPKTHRYITTGTKASKFGIDIERAQALAARARSMPSLRLQGIQCHIGSQITTVAPYVQAVGRTVALAERLREQGDAIEFLNMGGGFGIYYRDAEVPSLDAYADGVRPLLEGRGFRLIMEPGRVIVGNAGVLLTEVLYIKRGGDRRFVIVDAGMNDLLRPSLYDGFHRIWPVVGDAPPPLGTDYEGEPADVVGPVCESGDFLAKDRPLPAVEAGALLAVRSVGAYGFTMSSTYNSRPRPPEVLVEGDRYAVIRPRESHADLVRGEVADPELRPLEVSP